MAFPGRFPTTRMRRNRSNAAVRNLVAETGVSVDDLIWPIFITQGEDLREPIASMPGVDRLSVDQAVKAAREAVDLGIPAIALFPYTDADNRDEVGSEALNPDNLVCRAVRAVRDACPDLMIVCDVALDPFTSHGHDGLLQDGEILNDETVEILVKQALLQAEAGCDTLAPSDMMDGRIGTLRQALDQAGRQDVRLMSYAAKYASCFYGPFRDAIGSNLALVGDKRTYQMDPRNTDEALREVEMDLAEGADIVMVKPGMPYLDIIHRVKNSLRVPVVAYQVSGEYAMLQTAFDLGRLDRKRGIIESLQCFKRAGSDAILTYFARDAAIILNKQ